MHLEAHALADAGSKSIRFPGPLALVPAGAPATDTDSQEVRPVRPVCWAPLSPRRKEEGFAALRLWPVPSLQLSPIPRGLGASQMVSIAVKDRLGGSGINSQNERLGLGTKHSAS